MSVAEFECQIARGQIGRYVAGEGFSPEGLRQLGLHISECPHCQEHLAAKRAALTSPTPTHAVVSLPTTPASGTEAPSAAIEPEQPGTRKRPLKPIIAKPAIYSVALAAVLIAMTYVSHNSQAILGPKASAALPTSSSAPPPARVPDPVAKVEPKPIPAVKAPAAKPPISTAELAKTSATKVKVSIAKPIVKTHAAAKVIVKKPVPPTLHRRAARRTHRVITPHVRHSRHHAATAHRWHKPGRSIIHVYNS